MLFKISKSFIISFIIMIILLLLETFLVYKGFIDDSYKTINMVNIITLLISTFICAFLATKNFKSNGLILGAIFGIVFYGVLLGLNTLLDFKFEFNYFKIILVTISSLIAGILAVNTASKDL